MRELSTLSPVCEMDDDLLCVVAVCMCVGEEIWPKISRKCLCNTLAELMCDFVVINVFLAPKSEAGHYESQERGRPAAFGARNE